MDRYAEYGVDHLWLVDPALRTLEVYARDGVTWRRLGCHSDDDKVRVGPFDAVELDLSRWWVPRPTGGAAAEPGLEWAGESR